MGHYAVDGTLEPDQDDWFHARCECGFSFGPLPSREEVIDVLIEHATDAARREEE